MVKEPRPGRVKTRLGREIGMVDAARWFRLQSRRTLRALESPRWQTILAVAPDRAGMTSPVWPAHLARLPQGAGDLGARMARILRDLPPGPVVIVGADISGLGPQHVRGAFDALGRHDAVLGPADDGGFWLIGLRRTAAIPARLFEGVRWSTPHALADTLATLKGCNVALLEMLHDVDHAADLDRLKGSG